MNRTFSALILDDDPDACAFLKWYLGKAFPELRIATSLQDVPTEGFDIYLIDNDFNGQPRAVDLVRRIREHDPYAMVSVFSAAIRPIDLKQLIAVGCDLACEKGSCQDLAALQRTIRSYMQSAFASSLAPNRGVRGAIDSIRALLDSWNTKLEASTTGETQ